MGLQSFHSVLSYTNTGISKPELNHSFRRSRVICTGVTWKLRTLGSETQFLLRVTGRQTPASQMDVWVSQTCAKNQLYLAHGKCFRSGCGGDDDLKTLH